MAAFAAAWSAKNVNKQVKLTNLNIKRDILSKNLNQLNDKMDILVSPLFNARDNNIMFTRVNVYAVRNRDRFADNIQFWERIGLNAIRGSVTLKNALDNYLIARRNFLLNYSDQSPELLARNRQVFDESERILITEIKLEHSSTLNDINTIKGDLTKVENEIIESKP